VEDELRAAADHHARQARRVRANVVAWAAGTVALTTLWVVTQWRSHGALESFGHEGEHGQWNPTLWALGVGAWGLVVGIMALRVRLERPPSLEEVDREAGSAAPDGAARHLALRRLEAARRIRFHVAAWVLGVIVLTPLWALIEWQDNGDFERFSGNDQPGSWDPWILPAAAIWAGSVALLALWLQLAARRGGAGRWRT
jgi:hypothetical protein